MAAHAWTEYNATTGPLWLYNFCREAPPDGSGQRLIEALAGQLATYLAPGAVLGGLDGYQFDVAGFWTGSRNQGTRRLDCNNDGSPDSGFISNVSSYGLGVVDFFAALRQRVGPDIMLVSEATRDWSSRDFASSNGSENESFPDLHHWELFSSAYQRYQFWNQRAQKPNLSYLQVKETSEAFTKCPDRDRGTNWKYRLPMGAALLGNGYFAYIPTDELGDGSCSYVDPVLRAITAYPDEFEAGTQRRLHYLGRSLEEAQRLNAAEGAPNLLPNGDFEKDLSGTLLTTVGTSAALLNRDSSDPGEGESALRITISKLDVDPTDTKVRVGLSAFPVEKGKEYTLKLLVRAEPGYGRIDQSFADIPRRVQVELRIAGVPVTAEAEQDVLADKQWRTYWLSFVAGESDPKAALVVELGRCLARRAAVLAGRQRRPLP